jgi:hypothetical protein
LLLARTTNGWKKITVNIWVKKQAKFKSRCPSLTCVCQWKGELLVFIYCLLSLTSCTSSVCCLLFLPIFYCEI